MKAMYSMRSPAVKRLMKEAQELREPTELYFTQPLEDNLFEWHFTIRGPENSDFDGGIYHGRIILPAEYPMKPPNVIILTPNGRFETNKKICLSISGHHPESWQPSWSIRTALLAIVGFMPTHGGGAIGSLDYPPEERKKLAKRSVDWKCEHCGNLKTILKPVTEASKAANEEAKELASQINFRGEKSTMENKEKKSSEESATSSTNSTPLTTPPNTPVTQTFPNLSTLPGQFPFPAFPFPPQFQNMVGQQQQGSNFVPRFPFPPQFMPTMFHNSPFGNPFMPGNQFPGFQNSAQSLNSSQNNAQTNNTSQPSESSKTKSEIPKVQNMQSSENSLKTASTERSTVKTGPRNEALTEQEDIDTIEGSETETLVSQSTSTSTNASTSQSETTKNQNDISSGLRQRNVDQNRVIVQERQDFVQFADIQPEERQSGLRLSTVMIIILMIGILLLVFRRIYLQRMWKLPF